MTIRKLPSGSYQIREMVDGIRYSVTVRYKPRQSEAKRLIAEKVADGRPTGRLTVEQAFRAYIDKRQATGSPTTIMRFESLLRNMPPWLKKTHVSDVDSKIMQKYVDDLVEGQAVSTAKKAVTTLASVIRESRPLTYKVQYPVAPKKDIHIPEDDEVRAILEAVRGTDFEIPFSLCAYGLRRSEVCALELTDLCGTDLYICKGMVCVKGGTEVRQTKTSESTRHITISADLADRIRERGYICKYTPSALTHEFRSVVEGLGLPHMTLHKLRHYFCTRASELGIPESVLLEMGGWKTARVMTEVYRHVQRKTLEEEKKRYADSLSGII